MRMLMAAALFIAASVGAAPAYGESQLFHTCGGKALLGAGAGGVVGGLIGHDLKGAAVGAAVAGIGTYGVCRYIDQRAAARIDGAYKHAAATDQPYRTSWRSGRGYQTIRIARPMRDGPDCRIMNARLTLTSGEVQSLPRETYCRRRGEWMAEG